MKEYIERASVHSIIERTSTFAFTRGGMHEKIDSLPAADVVEVRHGRWIFKEYDKMPWCTQAICSECGAVVENNSSLTTKGGEKHFVKDNLHCRKCGARMDKEEEHD